MLELEDERGFWEEASLKGDIGGDWLSSSRSSTSEDDEDELDDCELDDE